MRADSFLGRLVLVISRRHSAPIPAPDCRSVVVAELRYLADELDRTAGPASIEDPMGLGFVTAAMRLRERADELDPQDGGTQ